VTALRKSQKDAKLSSKRHVRFLLYCSIVVIYVLETLFKNSLIIHEENTKKNHKRVVSLYVDKDFPSFT
jgi:uncharacterized protein (UPF0333 family)